MRTPLLSLLALVGLTLSLAAAPPPVRGPGGVVAADHPLSSAAGAEILAAGGNAIDAGVAAALAEGVVQASAAGLGGGGFAVVHRDGQGHVLDFREVAPAAGHAAMYLDDQGAVVPGLSTRGGLAVAVPGESRGLARLLAEHGTLSPKVVAGPAVRLASKGFALNDFAAHSLESKPDLLAALLPSLVGPPLPGVIVHRPRLADTLKAWARSGGEDLHTGPGAQDLAAAAQAAGGVLTEADLAAFAPRSRDLLVGQYRGYTILTMPPPSSGGAVLLQVLAVLEQWDLASLGHNSSAHLHLLAEAFQHAYADRATFMGDPDFTDVPVARFLTDERITAVRDAIDPGRTWPAAHYGPRIAVPDDGGTSHISVIDQDGLGLALTSTINTSYGSRVVAPRTGVVLNNEMDDFVAKPGVPNAYGLVGRAANAVEPGKKPLSSMTPTLVLDPDGSVVMALGGSGGPMIISGTLQVLSNVVDFGMDIGEAVSVPRVHHQWIPGLLFLDQGIPVDVQASLQARGHVLKQLDFRSAVQAVHQSESGLVGASDPRKGGTPAGVPARR